MENDTQENINSTNDEKDSEVDSSTEEVTEQKQEKHVETPEAKHARLKRQLAQHERKYGISSESKETRQTQQEDQGEAQTLSIKDQVALTKANLEDEDIDEVIEYARFKKITIAAALKSDVIQGTLAKRREERATAQATNTGRTRGTSTKVTGETLLSKAQRTGEIPEKEEDLDELLEARYKSK